MSRKHWYGIIDLSSTLEFTHVTIFQDVLKVISGLKASAVTWLAAWKCAMMESGELFAKTTGVELKHLLLAEGLASPPAVSAILC